MGGYGGAGEDEHGGAWQQETGGAFVTPIGAVGALIFTVAALRGVRAAFAMVALALPFGATAAVGLGPMTLLLANLYALLLVGLAGLRWLSRGSERAPVALDPPTLILLAFTAWAVVSGYALPRLFAGDLMVVPVNMGEGMFGVDPAFGTYVRPLAPSSGNVSQAAKAVIVALYAAAAAAVLRGASAAFAARLMAAMLGVHLALTGGQLILGDAFSALVHTADYVIHADQRFAGLRRVVGGFAEPSAYGGFSAMLYGYFVFSAASGGPRRSGVLAIAAGLACLSSLSSTAIAVFGLVTLAAAGTILLRFLRGQMRADTVRLLFLCGVLGSAVFVLVGGVGFTAVLVDGLILQKADSASGLERGYWTRHGFDVFVATKGLGAGMGSVRSNGLFAAVAGNLGAPGLVLLTAFLASVLAPLPQGTAARSGMHVLQGLRGAVAASVCAASLSATGAGMGVALVTISLLTVAVRSTLLATERGERGVTSEQP